MGSQKVSAKDRSFAEKWAALVEACLGGELIPFLGAGISYDAVLEPSHPVYGANMPATGVLLNEMLERVKAIEPRSQWGGETLQRHRPDDKMPLGFGEGAGTGNSTVPP